MLPVESVPLGTQHVGIFSDPNHLVIQFFHFTTENTHSVLRKNIQHRGTEFTEFHRGNTQLFSY